MISTVKKKSRSLALPFVVTAALAPAGVKAEPPPVNPPQPPIHRNPPRHEPPEKKPPVNPPRHEPPEKKPPVNPPPRERGPEREGGAGKK